MFGSRGADLAQVVSRARPRRLIDAGPVWGPKTGDTAPGPDSGDISSSIFWRAHLRTGFGVFLGEAIATAAYLAMTPRGPHRPLLWTMAIVWIASGAVSLALVPKVAARPWRAGYSVAW